MSTATMPKPVMDVETLHENIRARVDASPLSVRALSERAGISYKSMLRKLSPGAAELLTVSDVLRIARALGLRVEAFFEPVEETHEIRRSTEPGEPEQHGIGGGL